jgi:ribosomal protein S12 methylthiotransferase
MLQAGIKEIILIAQDTTTYGKDIYGEPRLMNLLEEIEKINADFHYRLLYLYPDIITIKELKKLSKFKKFIPYFDIPLQHISSPILKKM